MPSFTLPHLIPSRDILNQTTLDFHCMEKTSKYLFMFDRRMKAIGVCRRVNRMLISELTEAHNHMRSWHSDCLMGFSGITWQAFQADAGADRVTQKHHWRVQTDLQKHSAKDWALQLFSAAYTLNLYCHTVSERWHSNSRSTHQICKTRR